MGIRFGPLIVKESRKQLRTVNTGNEWNLSPGECVWGERLSVRTRRAQLVWFGTWEEQVWYIWSAGLVHGKCSRITFLVYNLLEFYIFCE
jgi:hypothetical protein